VREIAAEPVGEAECEAGRVDVVPGAEEPIATGAESAPTLLVSPIRISRGPSVRPLVHQERRLRAFLEPIIESETQSPLLMWAGARQRLALID
jgi:hypothetical protein